MNVIKIFENLSYAEKYMLFFQMYHSFDEEKIIKKGEFGITIEQIRKYCKKYDYDLTGNIRKDLSLILECSIKDISLTPQEAVNSNVKYHYGNIDRYYTDVNHRIPYVEETKEKKVILPEIFFGNLFVPSLKLNKDNFKLPKMIIGNTSLEWLEETDDLVLPEIIIGEFQAKCLEKVNSIYMPRTAAGSLQLWSIYPENPINEIIIEDKLDYDIWFPGSKCGGKPFRPKDYEEIKEKGYVKKITLKKH